MKKEIFQNFKSRVRLNHKTAIFLLCVTLAAVFWVFTSLSREYETSITIPVNYKNIPFTKYFDSELPKELEYHFRGTGFRLTGIYFRKHPDSIIVDVSAYSDKKKQLQFQTIALKNQFPGDLKPYKITPETIAAGLSSRLSKKVPIRLIGQITYRPRFEATSVTRIQPDSLELAGPSEILELVNEVKTVNLILSDVAGSQSGTIKLDSTSFRGLASSISKVKYNLRVEEFTEGIMEVRVGLPVSQRNRVLTIPSTVRITFIASLSVFPMIKNSDFRVETELPSRELPSRLPVKIKKQPVSVRVLRIEPEFLDYLVQK